MAELLTIQCPECETDNTFTYHGPTRVDPGYYETDLECVNCGEDLSQEEGEPLTVDDLKWARHPDV